MKDRIRQIMESQHMTQQVFAQFIEMSPASLSSIFNGRTKPTINIVEAIKKKIPDINTDWLMFGSGSMYKGAEGVPAPTGNAPVITTQQEVSPQNPMLSFDDSPSPTPSVSSIGIEMASPATSFPNGVKSTRSNLVREEVKIIDKPARRVTEIRIYYDDQTWESFVPSKK